MAYPTQLNPVQAWLCGYVDTSALRDQLAASDENASLIATYGRAIADPAYTDTLIAQAIESTH
jgi:hypothetical protein